MDPYFNYENTLFHKIGHISANNGPIFKIQNLSCSGLRARSAVCDNDVARDVIRAMTSRARDFKCDVMKVTLFGNLKFN